MCFGGGGSTTAAQSPGMPAQQATQVVPVKAPDAAPATKAAATDQTASTAPTKSAGTGLNIPTGA